MGPRHLIIMEAQLQLPTTTEAQLQLPTTTEAMLQLPTIMEPHLLIIMEAKLQLLTTTDPQLQVVMDLVTDMDMDMAATDTVTDMAVMDMEVTDTIMDIIVVVKKAVPAEVLECSWVEDIIMESIMARADTEADTDIIWAAAVIHTITASQPHNSSTVAKHLLLHLRIEYERMPQ